MRERQRGEDFRRGRALSREDSEWQTQQRREEWHRRHEHDPLRRQFGPFHGADYGYAEPPPVDPYWQATWEPPRDESERRHEHGWGGGSMGERSHGDFSERGFAFNGTALREHYGPDYRGRGPKGYVRSDERIHDEVCERLSQDRHVDAEDVSVVVRSGEVTLDGVVPSRRMKHLAENLAASVGGVTDVHNHLRVKQGLFSKVAEKLTTAAVPEAHQATASSGVVPRTSADAERQRRY